jgi:hypothetical protein
MSNQKSIHNVSPLGREIAQVFNNGRSELILWQI